MEKKANGNSVALAIVALLAGVLIGVVGAKSLDMQPVDDTNNASTNTAGISKAESDLRTTLNNDFTQHVALTGPALRSVFDGNADTEAVVAALDKNSVALADDIGSVYGQEKRDVFLEIWRSHIGFLADYTAAAKAADQAGMQQSQADLKGYVEEISTFLSGANENLPKETVATTITEHVDQVLDIVNAYGAENYQESYNTQLQAEAHMGMTADVLADAIAKQQNL